MKISNQQRIFRVIEELDKNNLTIAIPTVFIRLTGDIKAALFLTQLLYWSDKGKRKDGFIYKSDKEWESELGLSRHELPRIRKIIAPYVEIKNKKANGAPTLHYRLRINALEKAIKEFLENRTIENSQNSQTDLPEISKSITEITQKEPAESTTGSPLSVEDEWKYPDPESYSLQGYYIQQKILNICGVDEFEYGQKEVIKQIEQEMEQARNYSGSDMARYDPKFINEILGWSSQLRDSKPVKVRMILNAIQNDKNFERWSKKQKKTRSPFRSIGEFTSRDDYQSD